MNMNPSDSDFHWELGARYFIGHRSFTWALLLPIKRRTKANEGGRTTLSGIRNLPPPPSIADIPTPFLAILYTPSSILGLLSLPPILESGHKRA
jgi:hypothetical protein